MQTSSRRKLKDSDVKCGGGFWFAYNSDGRGMRRVYGDSSLKGYRQDNSDTIHSVTTTTNKQQKCQTGTRPDACEDSYDTLAKAVAFYNGETIVRNWPGNSWPEVLKKTVKTKDPNKQNDPAGEGLLYCFNCRYSVLVRGNFNLPKRTYIWKGGTYDVDLKKDDGTPDPNAGKEWCFAYGENEWMSGKRWQKVKDTARGDLLAVPPIRPSGRIDCVTGNSL